MFIYDFVWEITQCECKGCLIMDGPHSKLKYRIVVGFIRKPLEGTQMAKFKNLLSLKLQNSSLVFKLDPVQPSAN